MLFKRKQTPEKLVAKGDKYFGQKKYQKALAAYSKANELNPDDQTIYEKMINAHMQLKDDWDDSDLAMSLSWTMKMQELENPGLKMVHARMTPEWNTINGLIKKLLLAQTEDEEIKIVNSISEYGEQALYPLLDFVLGIKKATPGFNNTEADS